MAEIDPANHEEWIERYYRNHHVAQDGVSTETHVPCAFCACPGFQVLGILTAFEDMQREATCQFCGRSGKMIGGDPPDRVAADLDAMQYEFVQTGGEDPPPYLQPAPRRITPGE